MDIDLGMAIKYFNIYVDFCIVRITILNWIANNIIEDGILSSEITDRYASWNVGIGEKILAGEADLDSLNDFIIEGGEPILRSGRQEYVENIINNYI